MFTSDGSQQGSLKSKQDVDLNLVDLFHVSRKRSRLRTWELVLIAGHGPVGGGRVPMSEV